MPTSHKSWFRCLCWVVAYLLFFDTLSMSALRYVPGWPGLRADSRVSAAESGDTEADPGRSWSALAGILALVPDLLGLGAPSAAAGRTLQVSASDTTCGGNTPCFRTIQAAIDAAVPADRVRIHPGQYPEQLRIFGKNRQKGASESDRIVIEADPETPWGSVVLGPLGGARCPKGTAVDIKGSSFVTLRGLVLRNAGGRGVVLRGQGPANQAIHIERNRIHAEGDSRCSRGISIWHGNEKTLVANNLIDGTYREGIYVTDDRNGEHAIVSNTIYGNRLGGILLARRHRAVIANNLIIANGENRSGRRVGIQRRGRTPGPQGITLLGNLVCGNKQGELKGVLLDATDAGNLTPTGREGPGVAASPGCDDVEAVFAGVLGEESAVAHDAEDFRLAEGSPAIDAGVALVDELPNIAGALLRADLMHQNAVRPADGDDDGDADDDIGAIEEGEVGEATPTPTASPTPTPTPSPSPTPSPTPSPSPSPTTSPSPTPTPVPTQSPSPIPNQDPDITSTPITRIVVTVPDIDPPEPDFDFIEYTPTDLGSSRGDIFTTLPTTDPALFGFNGSDIRKVNFDKRPDGSDIASGTQLTNEYASLGVLMSSIPVSSGVFGGAASPPNATFIGPVGGQQSFNFTVPVVAVGIINTSPDQDRIQFFSPSGELMFSIRDQDSAPGPNFNVDRFVGARVTDSNLIGSILFQNEAGNDEFDELIFEVSTAQLPRADYAYDVEATDPDLDTLEYSLVDGPDGMQIDPVSGLVTWTPTSLDVGIHPVTVRVEDGRGGFDEQSYDLEVVEQPRIPLVVGETQANAQQILEAAGFVLGNVTQQLDPNPPGTVVGQFPLAGTAAPTGTAVDVAVSVGPDACPMCDACNTGQPGICAFGRTFCDGPFAEPECRTTIEPRTESCGNQIDEDCDGVVDEGGVPEDLPTTPPRTGVFVEPLGTTVNFLVNGGSAVGLASGDFDQDGVIDLAVGEDQAFFNGRRISIVLGRGDGTFGAPTYHLYPQNVNVNAVLAHDFDRDGPLDLLVPMAELQQVYFYRGDGNGGFAEPVASGVGGRANQIQTADLNCDGILDVASVIDATHVTVGFGNGDGTFAVPTSYTFNHNLVDLALADVNGDGHPDLVTGSHEFAPTTGIGVRLNDGAGQFGDLEHTPGQSVPDQFGNRGNNQVFGIQIADFDGDTKADAVASTHGPIGCFMFMKGNGDGTFALPDLWDGIAHLDPSWTCVGGSNLHRRFSENVAPDVNADGKPDVVFTYGSDDNRVVIGISRGDGTFEPSVFAASAGTGAPGSATFPRADGAGTWAAVVADVNGDCMLDVVTAGFGTNASQGRMGVLLARAPGDFHAPRIAPLLRDPTGDNGHQMERGVTVGDFDNDGNPDFAAGVGRAFFTVPGFGIGIDVFEGDGDGRGKALPFTLNNYAGTGSAYLRTADFDQDGFLDLVFQGGDGPFGSRQSVSTVFGAGDFTFGDRQSAYSPRLDANQANIRNIIVADFDDDDDPDVAALVDNGGGAKAIATFSNPRTRTPLQFVAEIDVGSGSNGRGLVAADFDGDDTLDLVAQDSGSNPQRVRFFKGNGDLTFEPGLTIVEMLNQGAASAEDFAAADLDGDGAQDLVMAQFFHGCAYVLLGHDDGTFDAPVCYPVWSGRTNRLAIADFDVDGSLDIAVGIEDAGLAFVRGRGDGTFENGQPYATGKHVVQVLNVADFNRDDRPDLLVSFNNANFGHSIVLSNPTGPAPTPTPVPTLPPGVTATPTPQPTASPSPSPSPSPRVTATPPADLESIVVEPVDQIILAGDTQAYTATGIRTDGTSLDLTGGVAWSSSAPGVATMSATGTATGVSGGQTTISAAIGAFSGATTLTVGARASDFTAPTAEITSPVGGAEVTGLIDVIGTAVDTNFLKYELAYSPAGETNFTLLTLGASPIANGVLGQFDPTLLINDLYDLKLTVFDRGGNETSTIVTVQVARERKVGLFSITFPDLSVPLSGLPITINRTYDSRDKGNGDFGIGWRLDVQTLRLRTNRTLGTGWVRNPGSLATIILSPTDPHKVSLTLPDGKVEEFDLQLSPTVGFGSLDFTQVVGFAPRPGTLGTLEVLANVNLAILNAGLEDELVDDLTFNTFDPKLFRYTHVDGTQIEIHRTEGVKKITDRNGNTLTFGPNGIIHSAGKSVTFTRDAQNRITQITDPMGHSRTYAYDANGDLIDATDFVGQTTHFGYNRTHGLIDIRDPAGNHPARNEYDANGRLVATIDAQGHRVEFTHNLGASQEIIKDRLGNPTAVEYDTVGNVVAETDALGGVTSYTHDSRGNELTRTDPLGRVATKTYDSRNNELTSTDFEGNTTTSTYNTRGQVLTITDPEGHTTTNVYDANGNLTQATNPEGGVTQHTYDAAGNQLTTTNPLGHVTTLTYDGSGNVTSETDPSGTVTTFVYNANGTALSSNRAGRTTQYQHDAAQRLIATTDTLGHQTTTTYVLIGDGTRPATTTNALGHTTQFSYDARGKRVAVTFPDGSTETATYDAESRVTSQTNRDGHSTVYKYDALGRQIEVMHPDGAKVLTTYDAVDRVLTQTDERGNVTTFSYAPNQETITDALGNVTVHEFDGLRRRVKTTDALGYATTFAYDGVGALLTTTFPDGTTKTATYDGARRKIAETDQAGQTFQFAYDELGRLLRVIDTLGHETSYTYDAFGNRLTQTDANAHTTQMTYDLLGRLLTRVRPLGQQESFTHDANGNQTAQTDFNGQTITLVYDEADRIVQKELPDGSVVPYAFTPGGLRTQAGDYTYTYDARGRLTKETKASGEELIYTYDAAGNRTSLTTPQGTTTYGYDVLNRLSEVTDTTGATSYTYDAVGNLASTAYPNGITTAYDYDTLSRLVQMTNSGPGGLISSYTYTLGVAGNREQVAEAGPATTGRVVDYSYDPMFRLTAEAIDEPGTANDLTIGYVYDAVGNRTQMTRAGVTTASSYDDNDRLTAETTSGVTTTYSYDANGSLLSKSGAGANDTYTYDGERRLLTANMQSGANPGAVGYSYDTDGMRTSKTSGGVTTTFLVDKNLRHAQVLAETTGGASVTYSYGHDLLSQTRPASGTHFYVYDGQLSTRLLTDTIGEVTDTYSYDAFGVTLASTGSTSNDYLYAGEQIDTNVGLYYLRARYYDQGRGRFISADPLQGNSHDPVSLHRYLYANDNPVSLSDPSGQITISTHLAVTLAVIGAFLVVLGGAEFLARQGRSSATARVAKARASGRFPGIDKTIENFIAFGRTSGGCTLSQQYSNCSAVENETRPYLVANRPADENVEFVRVNLYGARDFKAPIFPSVLGGGSVKYHHAVGLRAKGEKGPPSLIFDPIRLGAFGRQAETGAFDLNSIFHYEDWYAAASPTFGTVVTVTVIDNQELGGRGQPEVEVIEDRATYENLLKQGVTAPR